MFVRPIEPDGEGGFRLRLSDAERELLRTLPGELREILDSEQDDPSLRRLFPPAYERDDEAEDEYRRLMADELLEGRRAALRLVQETAGRERLSATGSSNGSPTFAPNEEPRCLRPTKR